MPLLSQINKRSSRRLLANASGWLNNADVN
jgi:hypothetical protein